MAGLGRQAAPPLFRPFQYRQSGRPRPDRAALPGAVVELNPK
jgi:hypothetical protein